MNKTLQEQLDYRKWIESERAERDLSGSMDFCAGCKYAYGNKCTVTDASVRTMDELCAENYLKGFPSEAPEEGQKRVLLHIGDKWVDVTDDLNMGFL